MADRMTFLQKYNGTDCLKIDSAASFDSQSELKLAALFIVL